MTVTARLALAQPVTGDPPSQLRVDMNTNAAALDSVVTYSEGRASAIPAPSLAGRRYYATDVGVELYDTGTTWVAVGTVTPVGTLAQSAGSIDPVDADGVTRWMICDGRAVNRTTFAALFTALSTTYGVGNGSTTFNIPDGRGRVLINAGPQTGCTTRAIGQTGAPAGGTYLAQETHALTNGEMASHNHGGATGGASNQHGHGYSDPGHAHHQLVNTGGTGTFNFGSQWTVHGVGSSTTSSNGTGFGVGGATARHQHGINAIGSGTAHNNLQPFLVVNHIIKVL